MYAFKRNYYLKHHGIQGQKWGVKNGPPYPLDSSKSTGKRLKKDKGTVRTGQPKKTSLKNKILNKIQPKKEEKQEEKSETTVKKEKTNALYGYEETGYGGFKKSNKTEDSNGKKVEVITRMSKDIWDSNSGRLRDRTEDEVKESARILDDIVKDFKTYDKIARDFALEDMRDRLSNFGDEITPSTFRKNLEKPRIYISDDNLSAEVTYASPDTYHWHTVEIDIKKKKATSGSMDG